MARFPKPAEGSWTEHYPELGTDLVSYEDSISPEFYELERKAIFRRAWLNVGRVEQLPRNGSYFTKELQVAKTSIIVVRNDCGQVRAFHNICRHRGNKLVWNDMPLRGDERHLPAVHLQVPRLALRPRRYPELRAAGGRVLRSRQETLRPRSGPLRRLGGLHLRQPRQGARAVAARVPRADDHLARGLPLRPDDRALALPLRGEGELEALHGRLPGVLPRTGFAREAVAGEVLQRRRRRRVSRRRTTGSTVRTASSAPPASGRGSSTRTCASPSRRSATAGCSGRGTGPTSDGKLAPA